jgi:hypothetical protein
MLFWQQEKIARCRWTSTISREATCCHLAGVTTLSSLRVPLLLSRARLASLSTGRNTLPGYARGGHYLAQGGTFELVAEGEVRQQGEGRMSRLKLHKKSGKVVLERAEGVASCLGEQLTSCAAGVQRLISAPALPHQNLPLSVLLHLSLYSFQ